MVEEVQETKSTKGSVDSRMAEISKHVLKLRKSLLDISKKDNPKANNPCVFWYSPRTSDMSCHILGHHIVAPTLDELLDHAEFKLCNIYNKIYDTNFLSIDELSYEDEPEKWCKERLIKEFKRLQDRILHNRPKQQRKPRAKKNEAK